MKIAIYSRKSRYTGKGESVQTQIDLCREYCDSHFEHPEYIIYGADEGYTGANTNRPDFQRMLQDARERRFDVLCCYRLDRISRNVSDFSRTLEELSNCGVSFVSLREQFDTSSPMGRAMIYIASVFSQLERDTLTERIRDNLHALAKEGRWLGGTPPTGYRSEAIEFDRAGRKRHYHALAVVPAEMDVVRALFAQYLACGSYAGVETYCLQQGIVSRNGKRFSRPTIKAILMNPVYCTADADAWKWFSEGDYQLCAQESDFDGTHGLMPFSRTTSDRPASELRATSEWIIAVGQHPGAISGADWVAAQKCIQTVKNTTYKAPRTKSALLSGLLVCGECGSYMRPKQHARERLDGSHGVSYTCMLKTNSRGTQCCMPPVDATVVDQLVLDKLAIMAGEKGEFAQRELLDSAEITHTREGIARQIEVQKKQLASVKATKNALVMRLSQNLPDSVLQEVVDAIEPLPSQIAGIEATITSLERQLSTCDRQQDMLSLMKSLMARFQHGTSEMEFDEKRRLLRTVVERIIWDGRSVEIEIFGEKRLPKMAVAFPLCNESKGRSAQHPR